jgi:hypothetical protein
MEEIPFYFTRAAKATFHKWFESRIGVGLEWEEQEANGFTAVTLDEMPDGAWREIYTALAPMKGAQPWEK